MDIAGLSTAQSLSSVNQSVNVGVLKSTQTLDKIVAAKLFANIGIGSTIDAYA